MYATLSLSGSDFERLKNISAIKVQIFLNDSLTPYPHIGEIDLKDRNIDPATGTVLIRVVFANPDYKLLSGFFVNAKLILPSIDALIIPQSSLIRKDKGEVFVWVVNNKNTVNLRKITLGDNVGSQWLVQNGLKAGDKIIIEGLQNLKEGVSVLHDQASK